MTGVEDYTHFRTSIPASPNLSAVYPITGEAAMTAVGAHKTQDKGAPALIMTSAQSRLSEIIIGIQKVYRKDTSSRLVTAHIEVDGSKR